MQFIQYQPQSDVDIEIPEYDNLNSFIDTNDWKIKAKTPTGEIVLLYEGGASNGWSITGNTGNTPLNFLGTLDDSDVIIKREAIESIRLSEGGSFLATGSPILGVTPVSGSGARMMWIPERRAFRSGYVTSDQWDSYKIGLHSFATGYNTTASGGNSVAIGYDVKSLADYSISLGYSLVNNTYKGFVIGHFNDNSTVGQTSTSDSITNRIFQIGNGTNNINRSNALTVLKSGNVGIGIAIPTHTLHVDGGFRLNNGTESENRILKCDADGVATWGVFDSNNWSKTGDEGTDDSVNFLGTIDAQDLVIKTYNTDRFKFDSNYTNLQPLTANTFISGGSSAIVGTENIAIGTMGFNALALGAGNITCNIGIGANALKNVQNNYNIGIGVNAGIQHTGYEAVFVGTNAGSFVTTGTRNTTFGTNTMADGTGSGGGSYENCAFGHSAMKYSIGAVTSNVAMGIGALGFTGGSWNTAIGAYAHWLSSMGSGNVSIGGGVNRSLDSGSYNCVISGTAGGYASAGISGPASENNIMGFGTGTGNGLTGSGNNIIGTFIASGADLSGANNVVIGRRIGGMAGNVSSNIVIGSYTSLPSASNGLLNIGNVIYGTGMYTGTTTTSTPTTTGSIGIGVTAPLARLHLAAGTTTLAPLKLTSGTPKSVVEDGAFEYDNSHLWFTIGGTRYQLDQQAQGTGPVLETIITTTALGNLTTLVHVNPSSVVSTLTITLPSTPSQFQEVLIMFGGLITSGNPVVTTLTISGTNIRQATVPADMVSGESLTYKYIGTYWMRIK